MNVSRGAERGSSVVTAAAISLENRPDGWSGAGECRRRIHRLLLDPSLKAALGLAAAPGSQALPSEEEEEECNIGSSLLTSGCGWRSREGDVTAFSLPPPAALPTESPFPFAHPPAPVFNECSNATRTRWPAGWLAGSLIHSTAATRRPRPHQQYTWQGRIRRPAIYKPFIQRTPFIFTLFKMRERVDPNPNPASFIKLQRSDHYSDFKLLLLTSSALRKVFKSVAMSPTTNE